MDKFKVGDRVKVIGTSDYEYYDTMYMMYMEGTVAAVDGDGIPGILFDEPIDGNDLDTRISCTNGWYVPEEDLCEI